MLTETNLREALVSVPTMSTALLEKASVTVADLTTDAYADIKTFL